MLRRVLLLLVFLICTNLLASNPHMVFAGLTAVSCTITKVGTPQGAAPELPTECTQRSGNTSGGVAPADATDCPIPNGFISCGSMFTPITTGGFAACGHCAASYPAASFADNCMQVWTPGTQHAIDVAKAPGVSVASLEVLLPKVNGHIIQWTYLAEEIQGAQSIQKYAGEDTINHDAYYLQLHHSTPGSGNQGVHQSGAVGAKIWSGGDHMHVQIGTGSTLSHDKWLDAAQYFCRQK